MTSDFIDACTDLETLRCLARARTKQSRQYLAELEVLRSSAPADKVRLLELAAQISQRADVVNTAVDRAWESCERKGWKDIDVKMLLTWLGHELNRTVDITKDQLVRDLRNALAGLPQATPAPELPDAPDAPQGDLR